MYKVELCGSLADLRRELYCSTGNACEQACVGNRSLHMKKVWTLAVCGLALCGCPAVQADEIDHNQEIAMARCSRDSENCQGGNCDYECDKDANGKCCEETESSEVQKPAKMRQSAAQKAMQREINAPAN